ncbi:MAG: branched-chain amino acid ABC transporter permease [Ilumatobacteraceae bacterium]
MPIEIRQGTLAYRLYVVIPWLLAIGVLVYIPFATKIGWTPGSIGKPLRIIQINQVVAYAVALVGLDLVIGYSGQLSLGQSAFIGVGAYTTVILVADHHWSALATLPVSAAVCFVAGLLVGIPATRVRGVYLAIITLVIAFVFPSIVLRYGWLTGGTNGKGPLRTEAHMNAPSWLPYGDTGRLAGPLWVYTILVVVAAVLFVLARNLVRSRPGRALRAVRDNQPAAVSMGVDVAPYKCLAFGVSAMYGGIAGSMLMLIRPFASEVQFGWRLGIFLVVGLVIGGTGTISGAVIGAYVYLFVPYYMSQWTFDQSGMPPVLKQISAPLWDLLRPGGGAADGIVFGLVVILLTFVLPGGCVDGLRRLRARVVRVVPNPAWLREHRRAHAGEEHKPQLFHPTGLSHPRD